MSNDREQYLFEDRTNVEKRWNTYNGQDSERETVHEVLTYASRKSPIVHSDHLRSTPYSRSGGWVTRDDPAETQSHAFIGDQYNLFHLSVGGHSCNDLGYPPGWSERIDNAEAGVTTRAREGLGDKSRFNVGVAFAEAISTANMLSGAVKGASLGILAFRRALSSIRSKSARERLLLLSGTWLETYYGWASLARDIFTLQSALTTKVKEPLIIESENSTVFERRVGPFQLPSSRELTLDYKGISKAAYRAQISDQFKRSLDAWGVSNPAAIAWEATPFSFVVDWFMPVGNYLSALSAIAGLDFVDGYVSTVTHFSRKERYLNTNPFTNEVTLRHGLYESQGRHFNRRVMGYFEPPHLYAKNNPFTTNHVTAAVALASQAVLGGNLR